MLILCVAKWCSLCMGPSELRWTGQNQQESDFEIHCFLSGYSESIVDQLYVSWRIDKVSTWRKLFLLKSKNNRRTQNLKFKNKIHVLACWPGLGTHNLGLICRKFLHFIWVRGWISWCPSLAYIFDISCSSPSWSIRAIQLVLNTRQYSLHNLHLLQAADRSRKFFMQFSAMPNWLEWSSSSSGAGFSSIVHWSVSCRNLPKLTNQVIWKCCFPKHSGSSNCSWPVQHHDEGLAISA